MSGSGEPRLSRRRLLRWGAVSVGVAAMSPALTSLSPASATALAGQAGTDGPAFPDGASKVTAQSAERASFEGQYQLAVLSEPTPVTTVVAFDVIAESRAELRQLLQTLTTRMRLLYAGGLPPFDGPAAPPEDSGLLGPSVPSRAVAFVLGFGASLFDNRFGLASQRPGGLLTMTSFPNDNLDPAQCQGDLSLQICASDNDTVIHALRDITKHTRGAMQARWRIDGFKNPPRPSGAPRNLLGFNDGIANPTTSDEATMRQLLWAQPEGPTPLWTTGGTYQVIRIIRMFVEAWDRVLLGQQEDIVGRRKDTGYPLGVDGQFTDFNYKADPKGLVTPLSAHIRLANPRTAATAGSRILRRGYNYDRGLDVNGNLDQGLLFTSYQQDLLRQFIFTQGRLVNEPMAEFISPVGGGYFFCPPGLRGNSSAYFGQGLL
jgi:deferrochelatase/peroxidase EfeB